MSLYAEKSHWYGWNAEKLQAYPVYEVPYAEKARGMRSTTLADARKLGLMKSVTAVTDLLAKPWLSAWKSEQLVHSALTLPRPMEPAEAWWGRCVGELGREAQDGEKVLFWAAQNPRRSAIDEDAWFDRIVRDAQDQSEKAKEFGTAVHSLIEWELMDGRDADLACNDPKLETIRQQFKGWSSVVIKDVYATEQVVGSPAYGVAGKLDCKANTYQHGMAYLDFKTQGVKKGKPTFYPEWCYQLAGYRLLDEGPKSTSKLMSVVIDRDTGEITHKFWTDEEADRGQAVFLMLNELWNIQNNYWPNV